MAELEHVNITVRDSKTTAEMLCGLFDWHIRWQGSAMGGDGHSVHVGSDTSYVALYSPHAATKAADDSYTHHASLNHLAVTVDDIDDLEKKVRAAGFEPINHADYEPGRRFYFRDGDNVEYEVVSYA